jgi:hypothetical protein
MKAVAYLGFQALVMLTWLPFREVNVQAIITGACRWTGWVSPQLPVALALFAGILLFSQMESYLERHFVRFVQAFRRVPVPSLLLPATCSACLYLILFGAGRATTFIYQRF